MNLKFYSAMVIAALAFTSCGGGGSSSASDALLFGAIPGVYLDYEAETAVLFEKAQKSDNIKDLQAINEKGETLKEELQGKLEKAAQAWSGTTLDVAVGEDLTIVAPITVTSDGFFSSTSPQFTLTGDVETAQEIDANYSETLLKYYSSRQDQLLTYGVLLVGLDEQGQELVSQRVGSVQLAWVNDHVAIPAKTKVSFDNKLSFNDGAAEAYTKVKSLMLKVDSK